LIVGACGELPITRLPAHGAFPLTDTVNPTRVPIKEKESIRWLENLKQSTELLGEAQRYVHIGDRESDIYLYSRAKWDKVPATHQRGSACRRWTAHDFSSDEEYEGEGDVPHRGSRPHRENVRGNGTGPIPTTSGSAANPANRRDIPR
jgi:hypothetical protein